MSCKNCKKKSYELMKAVEQEKYLRRTKERIENAWNNLGKIFDTCHNCKQKQDLTCFRIIDDENFKWDVGNRAILCKNCIGKELRDGVFKKQEIYLEEFSGNILNYEDIDTLLDIERKIRKNKYYHQK
jgi:hypothetical protein